MEELKEEIKAKYEKGKSEELIQILNIVQEKCGYIPKEMIDFICDYLNMEYAKVYGVITFYNRFTLNPKGKYNISVCMGTACFVKGSEKIMDRLKQRLGIEQGQTTSDGLFSIEEQRCVGACGLAPVFIVNDKVYGNATVKLLDQTIDKIIEENKKCEE